MMNTEEKINELVHLLYSSICFMPGETPDFEKLATIFAPDSRMISNNGDQPVSSPLSGYKERMTAAIESGRLSSFQEKEIAHRTEIFGKIAHRFSTYASRFLPDDPQPFDMGINSIQMMEVDGKWYITSLLWNNVNADRPLPDKYLP